MQEKVSNKIVCDLCKTEFPMTRDCLKEESVTLEKDGLKHDVVLTFLFCPRCGKSYPVIMDDLETLQILSEYKIYMAHRADYIKKSKPLPQKLQEKCIWYRRKLSFKRHQLAEKFNGAFYQYEGDTIQLDFCYREQ